jgi:hypothetical protein
VPDRQVQVNARGSLPWKRGLSAASRIHTARALTHPNPRLAMNPAFPTLLVVIALGATVARREWRLPWIAVGIAGMALMAPSLMIPDGIPSSAERMTLFTPWQETGPKPISDSMHFDIVWQIQPWLAYLRDQLRAGQLPFWNPHQFAGMGFWGNGQSAPLFPLHLIFVVLPNVIGWVFLPWMRLVLGGLGSWALARELGVGRRGSLLTALIYPLSGLSTAWLLYPMSNALALVPWVFWAVERLARGRASIAPLGLIVGLQLMGGHPGTSAHTAILCIVYLLVRVPAIRPLSLDELRGWGRMAAAWLLGGMVAAAHLLPFIDHAVQSVRWQGYRPALTQRPLVEVVAMLGRLVLPDQYGVPLEGTWWGPRFLPATAIYVGAAALLLAGIGLGAARAKEGWDRRWLGVAAVLVVSVLGAFEILGVGRVIQALPVARVAELRRLLFGVELALALLAGIGLQRLIDRKAGLLPAALVGAFSLLAFSWYTHSRNWALLDLTGAQVVWTAWFLGNAALLAVALRLPRIWRARLATLVVVLTAGDLVVAHRGANPAISMSRLYPQTGAVEFLQSRNGRLVSESRVFRPNAALAYGLYDVRGDDPMRLAQYGQVAHEPPSVRGVRTFDPYFRMDDDWLDQLDVRWVIAEAGSEPDRTDWELAYDGTDARIWRRPGATGWVRWQSTGTSEGLEIQRISSNRLLLSWETPVRAGVEIAEVHQRGWRAFTADGTRVPIATVADVLMGLEVGPGAGTITLVFRPPWLLPGVLLSAMGLLVVGAALVRERRSAASTT